ncbi:hypothetical protein [Sinomonas notoginsengisoli]|uniref:hypothetical protein n=1 Tax=Sinomonas notoginsengisoli TaxID=1457311 RepID=UPI001F3099DE|nr:hypothetical protein [Sinomonas notoginsengisoli]
MTAALGVEAVVHFQLSPGYQGAAPDGIGQGNLFITEASAAVIAGLYILLRGSRPAWLLALAVTGGGLAALLLYRYVDIPAFGPLPAMYEPVWYPEKTLTAWAEAGGVLLAGTALTLHRRMPLPRRRRHSTRQGPVRRKQEPAAPPEPPRVI